MWFFLEPISFPLTGSACLVTLLPSKREFLSLSLHFDGIGKRATEL